MTLTKNIMALPVMLLWITSCSASGSDTSVSAIHGADETTVTDTVPCQAKEDTAGIQPDMPLGVRALMHAYPDFVVGYADGRIRMADGSELTYDDGKEKSFDELLDNSDIEDMFFVPYEVPDSAPAYLSDAGRSRSDAFFKKMYGADEAAVRRQLERVDWFGQRVYFSRTNGAADSLRRVAAELAAHPDLRPLLKSSGTFYWRKVRGANRQSAHSYGIAFDIGVDKSDYWKFRNPRARETDRIRYRNRIPARIVEIFEKHGFIWGGAWYHYDTMHFEFRPELLHYRDLYKAHR
ncbi:MAG: M15 family metallopeptidase [Bacteroidales bacterium]|nr:M15 family metallopeptidase [Bacteroidales bacterium]